MKTTLKHIYLLFLITGIILAWTDYCFIEGSPSDSFDNIHHECPGVSNHSEISDHHGYEDQAFGCNLKTKHLPALTAACFLPFREVSIKNSFISTIWQPPKFV